MNKSKCPVCGSNHTKKNGKRLGVQTYKCCDCSYQFHNTRFPPAAYGRRCSRPEFSCGRYAQMPGMPQMGGMPQMKAAVPQVQYMAGVNGQPAGPFDWNQLQQLVQSGQLTQQSQVWTQGMPQWAMAGQVQELQPLFMGQTPAMPGMPQV